MDQLLDNAMLKTARQQFLSDLSTNSNLGLTQTISVRLSIDT
jgi:hypothetical protein